MELRHFLKLVLGAAAGAAALAAIAQAAPLAPQLLAKETMPLPAQQRAIPAVTTQSEVDHLKPEQVHWGHHGHGHHWGWHHHGYGHHWGWHHRGYGHHWGWHRHWHRHWGWHHHWHRHHW